VTTELRPAADAGPVAPATAFVASLRARPGVLRLTGDSPVSAAPVMTIRVEMPEVWDTVRVETPAAMPIRTVKDRVLRSLYPDAAFPEAFVMKLRGFEIRDESASVADAGARNGSIFLLTYRRRRPVRD
jgi:hypothetical protein